MQSSPKITGVIKSKMRQARHIARIKDSKPESVLQSQNLKGRGRQHDNSKMHIKELKREDMKWVNMAQKVVSLFDPHIGNNTSV